MRLHGHLWTIRPWVLHQIRPRRLPPALNFTTLLEDPSFGPVRLTGRLSPAPSGDDRACLLVVHGLGGDAESHYACDAAIAAAEHDMACLRLNLRGADLSGESFYNAALTADLRAAIRSPELERYRSLYVLGYSLGGHIALRYATEVVDERVRAVAAVCPPIDLERSAAAIDEPRRWVYRRHVLESLKAMYAAAARRRKVPLPLGEVRKIRHIRAWDKRVIAPYFGFPNAEAYYAAASVAPRLGLLGVPALLAASEHDPMVPIETLRPALASAAQTRLDVRYLASGGHVGFPETVALGMSSKPGLEMQVVAWLRRHT